jgi:hypothetical protein
MRIGKTALAVLTLALAFASSASFAAQLYTISTSLSHNGKLFGSPSAIVKDGTDATVAVSGPNGYKLALNVTDAGKGKLKIVTHLDSSYGSIAPTVVVFSGRPAMVSVGNIAIGITATRSSG